jgi:hypothetical protein
MITVVAIGPVAVTTNYWEEYQEDGTEEIGCRLQLRRLREIASEIPPPQPRRDATWWHIDEPLWRADLFTTVGSTTALDASHYHPTFSGVQPCERVFVDEIFPDPHAWMVSRLSDLRGMLEEAGHPELAAELDDGDIAQAMPAILSALATTLTYRPAHRADVP